MRYSVSDGAKKDKIRYSDLLRGKVGIEKKNSNSLIEFLKYGTLDSKKRIETEGKEENYRKSS